MKNRVFYYCRAREAVKYLKSKILRKNPRIQCHALELVEVAVKSCGPVFHAEVAAPEFMSVLARLTQIKEIPSQVISTSNSYCYRS